MRILLNVRNRLAQHQEIYYLIFVLIMMGLGSAGFTSGDRTYRILFAVAALVWLLKMAVTDYTLSEMLIMAAVFVLLGLNFLGNGEKTLFLSAMAVFGAKNVDINKVFKYGFFTKLILTLGVFAGIFLGLIANNTVSIAKNKIYYTLYCCGYVHPNDAFANCFIVFLMAVVVFRDKVKWYYYILASLLIAVTYKYIMCRTGVVMWIVLCLMLTVYRFTKNKKIGNIYRRLLVFMPVAMCIVTLMLTIICRNSGESFETINMYLSGRIEHINAYIDNIGLNILGIVPAKFFDNMYFYILYNYGWVIFVLFVSVYTAAMWYCYKKELHYELMAMAVMSIYGFMELMVMNAAWNFTIICISYVLFRKRSSDESNIKP